MLVSFSVENWKSFRDKSVLSLHATRERFRGETCAKLPSSCGGPRVLPAAALYGANASGKTTVLEGLALIQKLVVQGTPVNQMTGAIPFRLDSGCQGKPSRFSLEIFTGGKLYQYDLAIGRAEIEKEELRIVRSKSTQLVFSRIYDSIDFGKQFDNRRHRLIAENTRTNDLFLHNAVTQNAEAFVPLYNWFAESLIILDPDAQYGTYSTMILQPDFKQFIDDRLRRYRTGINGIVLTEVPIESIPIPPDEIANNIAMVPEGAEGDLQVRVFDHARGPEIFNIHIGTDREPVATKVNLQHKTVDGRLVQFDLRDEAQGTQRLIDLLPLFFDLCSETYATGEKERVYVVDELNKSFHSALTADLLKGFLEFCSPATRSQLLFTTHDLMLMEEGLLRKDEMWFCEKDDEEGSRLECLAKRAGIRSDTDILKNYREGALGGYPSFG